MSPNNGRNRIGERDSLRISAPTIGCTFHLFEFFRSQPSGFVNDVLGHGQLADVVQQSRGAQGFDFIGGSSSISLAISMA